MNRGGGSAHALCAQRLRGKAYSPAYFYTQFVNLYKLYKNVWKLFFPPFPKSLKNEILRGTTMQKVSLLFGEVQNLGEKWSVDS